MEWNRAIRMVKLVPRLLPNSKVHVRQSLGILLAFQGRFILTPCTSDAYGLRFLILENFTLVWVLTFINQLMFHSIKNLQFKALEILQFYTALETPACSGAKYVWFLLVCVCNSSVFLQTLLTMMFSTLSASQHGLEQNKLIPFTPNLCWSKFKHQCTNLV